MQGFSLRTGRTLIDWLFCQWCQSREDLPSKKLKLEAAMNHMAAGLPNLKRLYLEHFEDHFMSKWPLDSYSSLNTAESHEEAGADMKWGVAATPSLHSQDRYFDNLGNSAYVNCVLLLYPCNTISECMWDNHLTEYAECKVLADSLVQSRDTKEASKRNFSLFSFYKVFGMMLRLIRQPWMQDSRLDTCCFLLQFRCMMR